MCKFFSRKIWLKYVLEYWDYQWLITLTLQCGFSRPVIPPKAFSSLVLSRKAMAAGRVGCGPACALGVGLLLLLVAAVRALDGNLGPSLDVGLC